MCNLSAMALDRITDIIAFVRVADARSFTVAAEQLGLSRSAVGKCVTRLEDQLGVRLLHRTTRSMKARPSMSVASAFSRTWRKPSSPWRAGPSDRAAG